MAWTSPRREKEHATQLREFFAGEAEKELGRSLTPAELRQMHEQAVTAAAACGRHTRASTGKEG